ncbi:mCG148430 [Mus musculus]|nr:mCG148430 [Mus musculus]
MGRLPPASTIPTHTHPNTHTHTHTHTHPSLALLCLGCLLWEVGPDPDGITNCPTSWLRHLKRLGVWGRGQVEALILSPAVGELIDSLPSTLWLPLFLCKRLGRREMSKWTVDPPPGRC